MRTLTISTGPIPLAEAGVNAGRRRRPTSWGLSEPPMRATLTPGSLGGTGPPTLEGRRWTRQRARP
jgi:hypothetical protein